MPAFVRTRRFFGSITRAARSNGLTRRIYFRWRSFARTVAPHMIAQRTAASRLESERLRERLLLEFRGNNNLELPLLWSASLEATGAGEAVEVVSVIPAKECRSASDGIAQGPLPAAPTASPTCTCLQARRRTFCCRICRGEDSRDRRPAHTVTMQRPSYSATGSRLRRAR